ncbi:MAG: polymer-forming cytoskeletal protein [Flavitalea sp.]
MFNQKSKSTISSDAPVPQGGASIIAAGTTLRGDINSTGDIRIDGTLNGNINCTAKVVIGANGVVQGDISGQQADIMGKIDGTIKVKELLQLKGGSNVNGNIHAGKLQIETSANFNGQCHMTTITPANSPSISNTTSNNTTSKPLVSASLPEVKTDKTVSTEPLFTLK